MQNRLELLIKQKTETNVLINGNKIVLQIKLKRN